MKPFLSVPIFILIGSQAVLAPCRGISRLDENPPKPPFSISISARPTVVVSGKRFTIFIHLTNVSEHNIDAPSAWMGTFDAVYFFDIRNSAGVPLKMSISPMIDGVHHMDSRILGPGQSVDESVGIEDFFDMSKPGSYTIQVWRYIDVENPQGEVGPNQDVKKGKVASNTITITVIPATATAP